VKSSCSVQFMQLVTSSSWRSDELKTVQLKSKTSSGRKKLAMAAKPSDQFTRSTTGELFSLKELQTFTLITRKWLYCYVLYRKDINIYLCIKYKSKVGKVCLWHTLYTYFKVFYNYLKCNPNHICTAKLTFPMSIFAYKYKSFAQQKTQSLQIHSAIYIGVLVQILSITKRTTSQL